MILLACFLQSFRNFLLKGEVLSVLGRKECLDHLSVIRIIAIFSLADHHVPHTILYVKPLHLVKWVES